MTITAFITDENNQSHFESIDKNDVESKRFLGDMSGKYFATAMMIRAFEKEVPAKSLIPSNIIYSEGTVEIKASNGETRAFKPGDILLTSDATGKSDIMRTLMRGSKKPVIVTTHDDSAKTENLSRRSKM